MTEIFFSPGFASVLAVYVVIIVIVLLQILDNTTEPFMRAYNMYTQLGLKHCVIYNDLP